MNKTSVVKDMQRRSIQVSRTFDAPVDLVWRAYTEKDLLDQWWGPAPWRAETKVLDFREGGHWLYAMVGPEQQRHWARMNYLTIDPLKEFGMEDVFCDDQGTVNTKMPISVGAMVFTRADGGTRVDFRMTYSTEEQLKQIVEMGFETGITICNEQLAELLKTLRS